MVAAGPVAAGPVVGLQVTDPAPDRGPDEAGIVLATADGAGLTTIETITVSGPDCSQRHGRAATDRWAKSLIESLGSRFVAYYLTLGQFDAVTIAKAPDDETVAEPVTKDAVGGIAGSNTPCAGTRVLGRPRRHPGDEVAAIVEVVAGGPVKLSAGQRLAPRSVARLRPTACLTMTTPTAPGHLGVRGSRRQCPQQRAHPVGGSALQPLAKRRSRYCRMRLSTGR